MNYRINFKAVQNTEDVIKLMSILFGNQIVTIPNDFYEQLDKAGLSQYFTFVPNENNQGQKESQDK